MVLREGGGGGRNAGLHFNNRGDPKPNGKIISSKK